jgi:hypothetical protein
MKGKFVSGILAVTGLLALSSTVAQAGGGGIPSALTSFFVCHPINGANLGVPVDVYSDETGSPTTPTRKNVTIGQAVLACAQALLWPAGTQNPVAGTDISPDVPGNPSLFEMKCYSTSGGDAVQTQPGPQKTGQSTTVDIQDGLFPGHHELGASAFPSVQLICAPASITRPQ